VDPIEAITESCNIYFYTIADRLGTTRLQEWYGRWGLGDETVRGMPRAVSGKFIPNNTEIGRLIFGIGQGSVAWTPLHAAVAYARLAREGMDVQPRFLLDPSPETSEMAGDGKVWNRVAVQAALEGMRKSVASGTASEIGLAYGENELIMDFNDIPGGAPTVWAKTGTSQISNGVSHGWYAGLVAPSGSESPRYAFAVIVEHGNSGARSAGPVASQLIRQLAAEGYLGAEAASKSAPVKWIRREAVSR
jgi:penicillin-binding protein 2